MLLRRAAWASAYAHGMASASASRTESALLRHSVLPLLLRDADAARCWMGVAKVVSVSRCVGGPGTSNTTIAITATVERGRCAAAEVTVVGGTAGTLSWLPLATHVPARRRTGRCSSSTSSPADAARRGRRGDTGTGRGVCGAGTCVIGSAARVPIGMSRMAGAGARAGYRTSAGAAAAGLRRLSLLSRFVDKVKGAAGLGGKRGGGGAHGARGDGLVGGTVKGGLFGDALLQSPAAFRRVSAATMVHCDALMAQVITEAAAFDDTPDAGGGSGGSAGSEASVNANVARGLRVLHLMDRISDAVCKAVDGAEACINVHGDAAWREAALQCTLAVGGYIDHLNANVRLAAALDRVADDATVMAALTEEQRRFALSLQAEFRRDGIHLPDAQRARIVALSGRAASLAAEFTQRMNAGSAGSSASTAGARATSTTATTTTPPTTLDVSPASLLQGVPEHVLRHYGVSVGRVRAGVGAVQLPSDPPLMRAVLAVVPDGDVRRRAMAFLRHDAASERVLAELLAVRSARAQLLGHSCYADLATSANMAGSARAVHDFLQDLSRRLRPRAERELQALREAKAAAEGTRDVQPWDYHYYAARLKQARFAQLTRKAGASESGAVHPLHEYLGVQGVLRGLQLVVRRVFGVDMEPAAFGPNEAWVHAGPSARESAGAAAGSAAGVFKFVVRDDAGGTDGTGKEGAPLGVVYLDLFPRPHKYSHAAHFTVKCGRLYHPGEEVPDGAAPVPATDERTALLHAHSDGGDDGGSADSSALYQQLPVVVLVCNLAATVSPTGAVLLRGLAEVETLFHEFGHGLHSLLSRTEFQHFSGTRAALDFVELPSHLFEHFARDPRVVTQFAAHYSTGEAVPEDLLRAHAVTKDAFPALELQSQLVHAAFDQLVHGGGLGHGAWSDRSADSDTHMPLVGRHVTAGDEGGEDAGADAYSDDSDGSDDPDAVAAEPAQLLAMAQREYSVFGAADDGAWAQGGTHLVSYGAGYYSYLYARVFAAALWEQRFAADPLSREAGDAYRRAVLRHGGARDPQDMLRELLGATPTAEALLRHVDEAWAASHGAASL